jgi:hypothetical protein
VAAEKGPAGLTLFVDGIEVDHKPLPAFVDNDTADLRIGHYPLGPGSSSRMYGTIDEVQVFGRQLAVAEIQSLFNAGSHGVCRSGSCASCQPEVIYVANNTGGTISVIRDPL